MSKSEFQITIKNPSPDEAKQILRAQHRKDRVIQTAVVNRDGVTRGSLYGKSYAPYQQDLFVLRLQPEDNAIKSVRVKAQEGKPRGTSATPPAPFDSFVP